MDQMKPCFCWVGLLLGLSGVEPSRVTGAGLARRPGDGEPEEKKTEGSLKMRRMTSSITVRGVVATVGVGPKVPVQLSFQPSRNKYPFTLSTFLSYGIESMEGAFWDGEKAKRNDSFHWLISFALWHRWFF
ncbi:hypothetical protein V6N13_147384 [Hibiscus sabdariffa]